MCEQIQGRNRMLSDRLKMPPSFCSSPGNLRCVEMSFVDRKMVCDSFTVIVPHPQSGHQSVLPGQAPTAAVILKIIHNRLTAGEM